jgi:hypothetical protein
MLPCLTPSTPASEAFLRVTEEASIPPLVQGLSSWQAADILAQSDGRNAARLIAGWLSTRESIWWGSLCLAQLAKADLLTASDRQILTLIKDWVENPSDALASMIFNGSEPLSANPISLLSVAVASSGGSLPAGNQRVPGPVALSHKLVAHSVLQSADSWPANKDACLNHFIAVGMRVADQSVLWKKDALPAHPGLSRPVVEKPVVKALKNIWEN